MPERVDARNPKDEGDELGDITRHCIKACNDTYDPDGSFPWFHEGVPRHFDPGLEGRLVKVFAQVEQVMTVATKEVPDGDLPETIQEWHDKHDPKKTVGPDVYYHVVDNLPWLIEYFRDDENREKPTNDPYYRNVWGSDDHQVSDMVGFTSVTASVRDAVKADDGVVRMCEETWKHLTAEEQAEVLAVPNITRFVLYYNL